MTLLEDNGRACSIIRSQASPPERQVVLAAQQFDQFAIEANGLVAIVRAPHFSFQAADFMPIEIHQG
jgi:hypothetical protein